MKAILTTWAHHWRDLRAWGRPLEEITVKITGRDNHKTPGCGGVGSTGTAWPTKRDTVIRAGSDLPDALATILHEYAHLAAPGDVAHGLPWSSRFAAAVYEVTGIAICDDGDKGQVDRAATAAVRSWWKASGNEFAAKLLRAR
jgi:hypothetical protein